MNIEERYGRAVAALEDERERHLQTIAVLRALVSGEVALSQVTVTDGNDWTITPAGIRVVIEEPDSDEQEELGASEADGVLWSKAHNHSTDSARKYGA